MAMQDVNLVLAHGAWADGSSSEPVITALKAEVVKMLIWLPEGAFARRSRKKTAYCND
jgi:hypothetical protein